MEIKGYYLAGVHYRLEEVRCGKPTCKRCPHGPYWYAYQLRGITLKKTYVGKKLPIDVAVKAQPVRPGWRNTGPRQTSPPY